VAAKRLQNRRPSGIAGQPVREFVDDIAVNGDMGKLAGYCDGGKYIQHKPQIADGLSGLGAAPQAMAMQGITMKYERVHKVLGEGNFVLVASEGSFAVRATSFYDLFRVKNGKIAELWDTIEAIALWSLASTGASCTSCASTFPTSHLPSTANGPCRSLGRNKHNYGATREPKTYSVSSAFQARIACTIPATQSAVLFIPTDVTVQNPPHE